MSTQPSPSVRDWTVDFVQEHGGLLAPSQAGRFVVLSFDTLPRAVCGIVSNDGSRRTLSTTGEAVFWMLAIDQIMKRLDRRLDGEHGAA